MLPSVGLIFDLEFIRHMFLGTNCPMLFLGMLLPVLGMHHDLLRAYFWHIGQTQLQSYLRLKFKPWLFAYVNGFTVLLIPLTATKQVLSLLV